MLPVSPSSLHLSPIACPFFLRAASPHNFFPGTIQVSAAAYSGLPLHGRTILIDGWPGRFFSSFPSYCCCEPQLGNRNSPSSFCFSPGDTNYVFLFVLGAWCTLRYSFFFFFLFCFFFPSFPHSRKSLPLRKENLSRLSVLPLFPPPRTNSRRSFTLTS